MLALCDVFVWVTDPQKYADALLHDEYVQQLAGHSAVMLVVLNQVDRLVSGGAVEACREDLVRLLKLDGVEGVHVLTTSVVTGQGIPELRQRLANAVAGHEAARQRLSADLATVAARLRRGVADGEASLDAIADDRLIDALSRASGVPVVLDAVDEDYRREALGRTGWIFTRWGRKLRPDPLRRLRLDRVPSQVLEQVDPLDVREIVGRSSIPAPSASARSAVEAGGARPDRAGRRRSAGALGGGGLGRGRADRRPPVRTARPRRGHHATARQPADVVAVDGLAAVGVRPRRGRRTGVAGGARRHRLAEAAGDRHPEGGPVPLAHPVARGRVGPGLAGGVAGPSVGPLGGTPPAGAGRVPAAYRDRRRRDRTARRPRAGGARPPPRDTGDPGGPRG